MREKPAGGRSAEEVLDLLKDPEFCADALRVLEATATLRAQTPPPDEWQRQTQELAAPFWARWGVVPPATSELLDADPQRPLVDALVSGRWGIVPIFPWTTNQMIRTLIKKIRQVIRKQHKDALSARDAQLEGWLEDLGFERPAIARAVSGRRTGLRRPTTAHAISRSSWDRDQELHQEYRERGVPEQQLDQRVYKRLRGSEAAASAEVRMTVKRYMERILRLNENLATPIESEPLSHALTMLFQELRDEDETVVKQHALAVHAAFVAAHTDAQPSRHQSPVDGHWDLALVFPWTTDADVRARVHAIRVRLRAKRQDRDGVTQAPDRPDDPSPCEALVLLFRALVGADDLKVKQVAMSVSASFLKASAS